MEPIEPRPPLPQPIRSPEPARVPRRFGVGTLLLFTTMYALLFGLTQAAGVPPLVPISFAVFFTLVGLGQMLLFRGKKPRLASFVVGGAISCLFALGNGLMWLFHGAPLDVCSALGMFFILLLAFLEGGLLGYVAGCLLAGVFLLLKPFEKRREQADEAGPFAAAHVGEIEHDPE